MESDDQVCLCFHVSKRKIVNYCKREHPPVASLISECLSAGTGCGWCVPFIQKLHEQVQEGVSEPDLPVSPEEYARKRATYRSEKNTRAKEDSGEK
jgi:NAD(P)H-nitrite reductase large subunit